MRKTTKLKLSAARFFRKNQKLLLSFCAMSILLAILSAWFMGYKAEQEAIAAKNRQELGYSIGDPVPKRADSGCVAKGNAYFEQSNIDVNILDQAAEIRRNCIANPSHYN